MERVQLIATTIFGLESVVKKELADMGFARVSVSDGRVEFSGVLGDVPRLNIGLRAADRVLIKVAEFPAADFDALFDQTHALPWDQWIPEDAKITVTGKSARSVLKSVRSNQAMVKKAILKRMKARFKRDWFPETGPEFIIQISIFKDVAQLTLDTSGAGLHRRGYRVDTGEVPIRENLAAGLVLLSPWDQKTPLLDPMCGSGTLLIEAAMVARNIAPGLRRNFLSEAWPMMDKRAWGEARLAAARAVIPSGEVRIFGYDIDQKRIAGCQQNAKNAGVDKDIIFRQQEIKDLCLEQDRGQVISNPPYGVKMASARELYHLYAALNAVFEDQPGWALNIITADKKFPQHFKRARPDKIRKLYNGTIEVHFYQYRGKTVG